MFTLENLKIMALAKHLDIHMVDAEQLLIENEYKVTMLNYHDGIGCLVKINKVALFVYKC